MSSRTHTHTQTQANIEVRRHKECLIDFFYLKERERERRDANRFYKGERVRGGVFFFNFNFLKRFLKVKVEYIGFMSEYMSMRVYVCV